MEPQLRTEPKVLIPTRQSLLSRLKDWKDQASWHLFFETYWKLIYSTAIKAGLSDAEAQDVVQNTIISVSKNLPAFEYNPQKGSFKAWLLKLTRWRIVDEFRRRQKHIYLPLHDEGGANHASALEAIPDPLSMQLEKYWDEEWESTLVNAALRRVKSKVDANHFQVFDLYVLRGWSVSRVAKALNIRASHVYLVKHRINRLVKKEIQELQGQPF
jgi:RNA polymerase sigma factor (sigma-70 family)